MIDPNLKDDPGFSEFIEVVSQLIVDFAPHPEFPTFRVPRRHTRLDPICDHAGLDAGNAPSSRDLFLLQWDSFPGCSSFWHLHALRLPSGERVYWVDDANGRNIIAVGPGGIGADERFARALFKSNGESFGTGILDSAPSRITTALRGDLLITLFIDAFGGSSNAWDSIEGGSRKAVGRWLKQTLAKEGAELRVRLTKAQAQREFLTLIEGLVSDFQPHPDDPQVGVPRRFTPLFPLAKFLRKTVDPLASSLSYQLFHFGWAFVPGATFIQRINAMLLPDATRVFWFYLEEAEEESRHFVAGTAGPDVSDLQFLKLLFAGNGKAFGVEVCGSAPTEIITRLPHTPELTDLFVSAYNGFPQAWQSLGKYQPKGQSLNPRDLAQARELVDRHLRQVLA